MGIRARDRWPRRRSGLSTEPPDGSGDRGACGPHRPHRLRPWPARGGSSSRQPTVGSPRPRSRCTSPCVGKPWRRRTNSPRGRQLVDAAASEQRAVRAAGSGRGRVPLGEREGRRGQPPGQRSARRPRRRHRGSRSERPGAGSRGGGPRASAGLARRARSGRRGAGLQPAAARPVPFGAGRTSPACRAAFSPDRAAQQLTAVRRQGLRRGGTPARSPSTSARPRSTPWGPGRVRAGPRPVR